MLKSYLFVFFISMVPIFELRGAIPVALGMDLDLVRSVIICTVGNLLPVPVIYFFARKFLIWGLDKKYISKICHFFHDKGERVGERLAKRFGKTGLMLALILYVGIPAPMTGAWTGTLGASFLNMGAKETAVSVSVGVVIAATIMTVLSLIGVEVFNRI